MDEDYGVESPAHLKPPFWFRALALPSSYFGLAFILTWTYLLHLPWQGWVASFLLLGCLTQLKLYASYGLAASMGLDPLGFGGGQLLPRAAVRSAAFFGVTAVAMYIWAAAQ